jgi:hypothetical protein
MISNLYERYEDKTISLKYAACQACVTPAQFESGYKIWSCQKLITLALDNFTSSQPVNPSK